MIIENMFGTDGIRKKVGNSPLTSTDLPSLGSAIAQWALQQYGTHARILLAQDTRISAAWIKATLKSGMLLHPVALIDAHVLPTPAAYLLVHKENYDCAVIISASHNPYQDNGIKIIAKHTGKLQKTDELFISQLCSTITTTHDYASFGTDTPTTHAQETYINAVMAQFTKNFLHNKTIVLDCAHGATYHIAPEIFKALGATVIAINNNPDGININHECGAVHPEQLAHVVRTHNADAGFAFDGDGDRLTVVAPDGSIKDGDAILALLHQHPAYKNNRAVVGTIMSNQGLEEHFNAQNTNLLRTPVGDKHVAQALHEHNLLLGGEPSGHIIMRDYLNTGDGIFAALRVMETIELTQNYSMQTFKPFPHVLINVHVGAKKDLSSEPISSLIAATQAKVPHGRLIVRYSGTENVVRIFVEDQDDTIAQQVGSSLAQALQKELR